ncbi:MAG: four helix bundle protein [Betaproteobacteria bacterium]|nr:MAG: four helix bundle protein [Betaproteobacteria bacterium]
MLNGVASRSNAVLTKSFDFAPRVIKLSRQLREQREFVLSDQLLRAGTSIGAQVEEAQAGQSRKDFVSKMAIASKEAREARYWLRLIQGSAIAGVDVRGALEEVAELIRIITAIVKATSRAR